MQFNLRGIGPKESILVVADDLLTADLGNAPTKKDHERHKNTATKDKSTAGKGAYGQVGFNYDTGAAQTTQVTSTSFSCLRREGVDNALSLRMSLKPLINKTRRRAMRRIRSPMTYHQCE